MMADVFRVGRILAEGGLYVDAATIAKAPLLLLLQVEKGLLLLAKPHMDPSCECGNGLIYSREPGRPFLALVWSRISAFILARRGASVWLDFGPGLFQRLLRNQSNRDDVAILPAMQFAGEITLSSSAKFVTPGAHWSVQERRLQGLYLNASGVRPSPLIRVWDRARRLGINLASMSTVASCVKRILSIFHRLDRCIAGRIKRKGHRI